jgi:hypothetical protein
MTDITRDPYGNPLHTRSREQLIEIVADVVFQYRDPPASKFWGKERSRHMAEVIVRAISQEPRT